MQPTVVAPHTLAVTRSAARLTGRRGEFLLLASVAVVVPLAWWMLSLLLGHGPAFNDFHDYWLAGKLVSQGHSPYDLGALRALATADGLHFVVGTGYSYPLPFAILMVPFAALPFDLSVLLFSAISVATFGLTVAAWIGWAHGSRPEDAGRRLLLAFAAGAYPPVYGTLASGQVNLVLLGSLALGTALVLDARTPRGRVLGGVAIGLAAIVKLIPALLVVPFALARRGASLVGVLAGSLGSLIIAGLIAPAAGAGSGRLTSLLEPDAYFTNQSINGFVSRFVRSTDRTVAIWPNAFDPHVPALVLTGLFAGATGFALWRARARLTERRGLALAIGVALVAGLIGAPKASFWTQALGLLGVGLLVAADAPDLRLGRFGTERRLLASWFAGAALQAVLWILPPAKTVPLAPLITLLTSASGVGMLALWWLLVRRLDVGVPGLDPPVQGVLESA